MKDRFDQHLPPGNKVRGTKPTKKLGIIMVVLFCLFVGCHGKQAMMKLIAGKNKTLSISTDGQNRMFYITVPKSSIVTCKTTSTSTSGDADLYAEFGSEPNTNSVLASEGDSANETIGPLEAITTSARRLYVMVYAYTVFLNVQLRCDLTKDFKPALTKEPSSNPSENPSQKPSGNPSENPSENPSSNPTGCKDPGESVACPQNRPGLGLVASTRLCCSGRCTRFGVHRCCLPLDYIGCTSDSSCCSGHCVSDGLSNICILSAGATEAQLSIQDP